MSISTGFGILGSLLSIWNKSDSDTDILELVKKHRKDLKFIANDGSMTRLVKDYIVEPTVVISSSLKGDEYIDSVLGVHMDIFCAYYTQAFDALTRIHGVQAKVAIRSLGTNNSSIDRAALGALSRGMAAVEGISTQDYISPIEDLLEYGKMTIPRSSVGLEDSTWTNRNGHTVTMSDRDTKRLLEKAKSDRAKYRRDNKRVDDYVSKQLKSEERLKTQIEQQKLDAKHEKQKRELEQHIRRTDKEARAKVIDNKATTVSNVIMREIEVTVYSTDKTYNEYSVIIPIKVFLNVVYADSDSIVNLFDTDGETKRLPYRYADWRSGYLSTKNFLTGLDLIDAYKKNLVQDKADLIKFMRARTRSANIKMHETGMVGFEKYYAMYILSNDDLSRVQRLVHGKIFSNHNVKNKAMELSKSFIISNIDQDYSRMKMSIKDVNAYTDASLKDVKKKSSKETDMDNMLKLFMANKAPQF